MREPTALGENDTLTTVLPPAGIVIGSVPELMEKSEALAPESVSPEINRLVVPVLLMVTGCCALRVFTCWPPKFRLAGFICIAGAPPIPLNGNICGLPTAFVTTLRVPDR